MYPSSFNQDRLSGIPFAIKQVGLIMNRFGDMYLFTRHHVKLLIILKACAG